MNQHFLGVRVSCEDLPGLVGTIVYINSGTGMWRRDEATYDVVWDDMTCSRAVSRSTISGPGWSYLSGRRTENECNRIWYDYQIQRTREMQTRAAQAAQARAAQARPAVASAASSYARVVVPAPDAAAGGNAAPSMLALLATSSTPEKSTARAATAACRVALESAFPGSDFAVNCQRRILTVAWMDGPLPGSAYRVLKPLFDDKLADSVRFKRSLTEAHLQVAIDYCLWRIFSDEQSSPRAAHAAICVTPDEYLSLGLSSAFAPSDTRMAGMSYQSLIRCVVDRWDDAYQRFQSTRATRGMVRQIELMFPDGHAEAVQNFLAIQQHRLAGHESTGEAARHPRDSAMRAT